MLKDNNDEQLRRKGVMEKLIPFYQIWQELVNEKTLDIYQYRILTSLSALEELSEVLRKTLTRQAAKVLQHLWQRQLKFTAKNRINQKSHSEIQTQNDFYLLLLL